MVPPVAGVRLEAVWRFERLDVDGFMAGLTCRRRSDRDAGPETLGRWEDARRLPTTSSSRSSSSIVRDSSESDSGESRAGNLGRVLDVLVLDLIGFVDEALDDPDEE